MSIKSLWFSVILHVTALFTRPGTAGCSSMSPSMCLDQSQPEELHFMVPKVGISKEITEMSSCFGPQTDVF